MRKIPIVTAGNPIIAVDSREQAPLVFRNFSGYWPGSPEPET
jgi:hypothetical protein